MNIKQKATGWLRIHVTPLACNSCDQKFDIQLFFAGIVALDARNDSQPLKGSSVPL